MKRKSAGVLCKVTAKYMEDNGHMLLTQYCAGGKIKMNEMGRACGAYGGG